MKRFRQILVVLTDSSADRRALQWARLISKPARTERIQVLVLDTEPAELVAEYPPVKDYEPWKERVHESAELVSEVFEGMAGVEVRTKTGVGAPLATILQELVDSESDLAVLGVAGEEQRRLAEKLARKSPVSILSVPEESLPDCRLILTPLDFSPPSALALDVSNAFARSFGARIHALHSFRIPSRARRAGISEETLQASHREAASGHLANFLGRAGHLRRARHPRGRAPQRGRHRGTRRTLL